ncbi:MAG: hypothetical protein K5656_07345 [Lachnospiraceae bacterium]|nr:hypothetical protein [Lachnospiraceae bacterium]
MKYIKLIIAFLILVLSLLSFTACGKKETSFDFGNVAEARIYTERDAEYKEFIHKEDAQKLIKPIGDITWERSDEAAKDSANYIYRIQCYTIKGEKSKNIKITSDGRIIYKDYYWIAEGDKALDLTFYSGYFKE